MSDTMEQALTKTESTEPGVPTVAGFGTKEGFELILRQAKWLSCSNLVPQQFQGDKGVANAVIALEMANRLGASPLAVFQNLYIVHGKPGWSAQFITAAINSTGKFSPLRFEMTGTGETRTCTAWALEKATGERLESPPVSIAMAKAEGWVEKTGSKWKTMPELMLRYRAATFFGRLYAPEVLMGMRTVDEVEDMEPTEEEKTQYEINAKANKGPVIDVEPVQGAGEPAATPTNGTGAAPADMPSGNSGEAMPEGPDF